MKLHRINALLLKYYYITISRGDRIFDLFYWPAIDLFVWGFASFYIQQLSDVNILSILMGSIILWMFVWRSSQDIAVFVLEDFWCKNLYNLFSSPIRQSEHVVSIIIFGFLRSIVSFLFMSAIAYGMYSLNIFSFDPLTLGLSILLLSLFGWFMGLLVTSFIFRYGERIQVLAWSTVWVVQPFSCVFYPLSALPTWAAKIAVFMPTTYAFEALRNSTKGVIDYSVFIWPLILSIALLALASLFLESSFKKAKQTGLLVKGN